MICQQPLQFEPSQSGHRSRTSVLFGTILGIWISACVALSASAQEASPNASVEELTAMLQSIDPYRPNSEAKGVVRVAGSTSMDAMAHGWANCFKQFHTNIEVEISGGGSETTFERLQEDPDSVGMLSRPLKEEELERLRQLGLKKPTAFVVAREALGVFVHSQNPVASISGEQLRAVFTAKEGEESPTWGLLGATDNWADRPIHVVSRTENSGTQRFLEEFVFHSATMRPGVSSHSSNSEVLKAVSADPLAIAICGLRSTGSTVRALQLTAGATVVPSDDHAVLSGQYPLTRPLTLVIDMGQTSENAKASQEFVHYALCQAGQAEAILAGFFPVDLPLLRAGLQKLGATQLR